MKIVYFIVAIFSFTISFLGQNAWAGKEKDLKPLPFLEKEKNHKEFIKDFFEWAGDGKVRGVDALKIGDDLDDLIVNLGELNFVSNENKSILYHYRNDNIYFSVNNKRKVDCIYLRIKNHFTLSQIKEALNGPCSLGGNMIEYKAGRQILSFRFKTPLEKNKDPFVDIVYLRENIGPFVQSGSCSIL